MSIPPPYDNSSPPTYEKKNRLSYSEEIRIETQRYINEHKEKVYEKVKKTIDKNIKKALEKIPNLVKKGKYRCRIYDFTLYVDDYHYIQTKEAEIKKKAIDSHVKYLNNNNIHEIKIKTNQTFIPNIFLSSYDKYTVYFDWS